MTEDYYALLGVSQRATDEEIKKSYRRLARELHPDTNPGDPDTEERFKKITVAYETLRDPERRRRYDVYGEEGAHLRAAEGFSGLGDIFDAFFGSAFGEPRRATGAPTGADAEVILDLGFREAVFGVDKEVRFRGAVPCDECGGSGARPGTSPVTCASCGGSGQVRRVRQSILGQMVTAMPCDRCGGIGEEIASPCRACRGDGRTLEERTFTVSVPAGVDNGATLRVRGLGAAGPRGGPAGDLYVHLRVAGDDRFTRHGNDLVHDLHIPVTQAALGAHLKFETLDGVEDLVIPEGAQSGRQLRLRTRGVPTANGRGRGDLVVRIVVDTPTDLSPTQEESLRALALDRGEDVAPPGGLLSRIRSAFR